MKHYTVPGFLKYCEKTLAWYDRCTDTSPVYHSVYLPIGLIMSILHLSVLLNVFTFCPLLFTNTFPLNRYFGPIRSIETQLSPEESRLAIRLKANHDRFFLHSVNFAIDSMYISRPIIIMSLWPACGI